ncbi:hypothetical protein Q3G72_001796 [Acer saccharum]|nr:hypothetical protein Q3G72_001796 [Acer saccharum]
MSGDAYCTASSVKAGRRLSGCSQGGDVRSEGVKWKFHSEKCKVYRCGHRVGLVTDSFKEAFLSAVVAGTETKLLLQKGLTYHRDQERTELRMTASLCSRRDRIGPFPAALIRSIYSPHSGIQDSRNYYYQSNPVLCLLSQQLPPDQDLRMSLGSTICDSLLGSRNLSTYFIAERQGGLAQKEAFNGRKEGIIGLKKVTPVVYTLPAGRLGPVKHGWNRNDRSRRQNFTLIDPCDLAGRDMEKDFKQVARGASPPCPAFLNLLVSVRKGKSQASDGWDLLSYLLRIKRGCGRDKTKADSRCRVPRRLFFSTVVTVRLSLWYGSGPRVSRQGKWQQRRIFDKSKEHTEAPQSLHTKIILIRAFVEVSLIKEEPEPTRKPFALLDRVMQSSLPMP